MTRNSARLVCLDLTPERLAGIEVAGSRVERAFSQPLLPGTLPAGAPASAERLASQLRAALAEAGVTARRARMAIPESALLTRVVILPRMPDRDLRRAATYAAERAIPIPKGEADWSWTSTRVKGGGRALRVVAGWRDVVAGLQHAAELAGLTLEAVEPRSAAIGAILPGPLLLVERVGDSLQVTARAPEASPFVGQIALPEGAGPTDTALESLLIAARRHLGSAGNDLAPVVTDEVALAVPTLASCVRASDRLHRPPAAPAPFAPDRYLAALGLSRVRRRSSPALASAAPLGELRGRVRRAPPALTPALAAVSVVSWSTVAAGAALLLGWHPSWPLAP